MERASTDEKAVINIGETRRGRRDPGGSAEDDGVV